MSCTLRYVEHVLVVATDWLMEQRMLLHAWLELRDNLRRPPPKPVPTIAPVVVRRHEPRRSAIQVEDYCAFCGLTWPEGMSTVCPRCGNQVLEVMPEQYMEGVS